MDSFHEFQDILSKLKIEKQNKSNIVYSTKYEKRLALKAQGLCICGKPLVIAFHCAKHRDMFNVRQVARARQRNANGLCRCGRVLSKSNKWLCEHCKMIYNNQSRIRRRKNAA